MTTEWYRCLTRENQCPRCRLMLKRGLVDLFFCQGRHLTNDLSSTFSPADRPAVVLHEGSALPYMQLWATTLPQWNHGYVGPVLLVMHKAYERGLVSKAEIQAFTGTTEVKTP